MGVAMLQQIRVSDGRSSLIRKCRLLAATSLTTSLLCSGAFAQGPQENATPAQPPSSAAPAEQPSPNSTTSPSPQSSPAPAAPADTQALPGGSLPPVDIKPVQQKQNVTQKQQGQRVA